jgi:hypothetical protein
MLVLFVGVAALLLLPGSALAKKKHKKPKALGPVITVEAKGPTVSSPSTSTADAICPAGLQAVGGGFSAPFDGVSANLVVIESYRSSPSTWRVVALAGDGTGAATAYAYCRRNTRIITDVAATATIPSGTAQSGKAQALCPPGIAAISGGFQITAGPGSAAAVPMESIGGGPTPGGVPPVGNWSVVAQSISIPSQTITAHAYCMAGIKLPAFRQDQASALVPRLGTLTETSTCPAVIKPKKKGKKKRKKTPAQLLSAGAFYSPFTPGSSTVFPLHTDSRIVGTGFIDTAVNVAPGGGTMTVQSQAMCF